ncbi:MAG: DUF3048 domain-containing protein [Candidatus Saccharimonadales bacterium]
MLHKLHTSIIGRVGKWINFHHTATYALAGAGVLLATIITAVVILYQPPKAVAPASIAKKVTPPPAPIIYYSQLTGEQVPDQPSAQRAVTGIMIENSPDARPQSGLKSAGVVFEAVAEGGITRFLALYQQSKPQLIGPVRSVRLYYVDWIAPFQASVAHIGGSKFALNEVRNGNYRDIDQFFNSGSYWRATDRYAPHNVYTSFERLDALNAKKGYTSSIFTVWPRLNGAPSKTPNATKIDVKISSASYNSHYDYDSTTNKYNRFEGGAPHNDRELGQITPSTVIVMDTTMTKVFEDGYREQITTIGSGRARIFQNGIVHEVTWTKRDRGSQISFTDAYGKEVPLNRGQTWIAAVPANQGGGVTWK